ncbi:MAG: dihydrofolate synthase/folylpolyglutamate synthase [Cytophagales bacterium]|jgi:dihydrofolate synthase/folylpolyglutamate synthase|nr:bifunctional folylpolyglutamate synthase/dihydrofolate synthase [Bacteroidota bacterium]MBS1980334.1 bifunctional folylpolyglutamate synthase/dihydrofolate synthase [Bacteroidota bacterium]WHZ08863.1 MAG: dihydrofolate synthase/folylpolyglutamate synthase [Cytophagales bacterium]
MDSYQQTLDYLYQSLPMFQRVGAVAYKKDLVNTLTLCKTLGNPHTKFKSIHIAGTNGKGSSSHMLAAILQSAGYKTGLYTSPHLKNFTERIKVNGHEITRQFVVDFVNRIQSDLEKISPSFFETTVAMAFDYFANEKVEVAVIEVGLGGRLDSTNVITPEISLITNISWDHADLLGDTLPKIAAEKAGIIKPGVPVVISERQPPVQSVFENKANEMHSAITFASNHYDIASLGQGRFSVQHQNNRMEVELELKGSYQQKNLAGVLAVTDEIRKLGFEISEQNITEGLKKTVTLTGLKGRWQKLGENPWVVCDTGHNEAGIREVLNQIAQQKFNQLHIVWGMVKDKDPGRILKLLPANARYYFCEAKIPRALPADMLKEKAAGYGLVGESVQDVNEAIARARQRASSKDLIFIGGSTFVVAEIENL